MASDFPLRSVHDAIQARMVADFEHATKEIEHRGAKGREREALAAKAYFEQYLPGTVRLVHGAEIIDSDGGRSAECDLVVTDPSAPPLFAGETFRLIPAEWAHGIIEVKTKLDATELRDAQSKIARAKSLTRQTYVPLTGDILTTMTAYGRTWDYFPMYGMVFAYTSTDLGALAALLWELQEDVPIEQWVDTVVVLDRGNLMYAHENAHSARPEPGCMLTAIASPNPLVPATLCLQTGFGAAWMRPAKIAPYFGPEPWGDVVTRVGP